MTLEHFSWRRPPSGQIVLVALLVVLCFACHPGNLAAAPIHEATLVAAAPCGVLVGSFLDEMAGNRTRMIQVGCAFVAIGVFLLTRSYR